MSLTSARSLVHQVFVVLALLLTVYVGLVAFGVLKEDVSFTATVAMSITILTALLGMRDLLDRRLEGQRGIWWMAKLSLAFLALALGVVGGGYCAINMDAIIVASPFFKATPMIMGALLLAGDHHSQLAALGLGSARHRPPIDRLFLLRPGHHRSAAHPSAL